MGKKRTAKTNPNTDVDVTDRPIDPLDDLLETLRRDEEEIGTLLRQLQEGNKAVEVLLQELAHPTICPLCGRQMSTGP